MLRFLGVQVVDADCTTMTPRALFHPARLARRPVLSTQSDERLVDLVRAGSEPAFEAIVERYRRALMRYVSRLLPPERAEDVVQQAFVNAYEAMQRGDAELNLKPWLYRIAHNSALNALRDRGAAPLTQLDDTHRRRRAAGPGVRADAGPARAAGGGPGACRTASASAIVLRELEGRSYAEIATCARSDRRRCAPAPEPRAQLAAGGGRGDHAVPLSSGSPAPIQPSP